MPELPEVETVTNALHLAIKNLVIKKALVYRSDLRIPILNSMNKYCANAKILSVSRRAKFGLIYLDNAYVIIFHLGMSGRIILGKENTYIKNKHDHLIIQFKCSNKNKHYIRLIYNDPRRFGFINIYKKNSKKFESIFKNIGPEPLSKELNANDLYEKFRNKSISIKSALLNQSIVAGLGNIYVSEILYASFISPQQIVSSLSLKKIINLVFKIRQVLKKAISLGGATIKDHQDINGKIGYFQNYFLVYDREGKVCKTKNCSSKIKRIVQNGRSSYFCPVCQK